MSSVSYRQWTAPDAEAPRQSRGQFPISMLAYPLAVAISLAVLMLPLGTFGTYPPGLVVWGTAGILLALAIHGYVLCKRQGDNPWLAPRSLLMFFFFFKFGFGTLVIYYWDRLPFTAFPQLRERFFTFGVRANLENACQLVLLGGLGLFIGLNLPFGRLVKRIPAAIWPIDQKKLQRNVMLYLPVALLVTTVLRYRLPVGIQGTISTFGAVSSTMLALVAAWWTLSSGSERVKWSVFLAAMIVFSFVGGFTTGMVGEFMYPAITAVFGYIIVKQKLPWRFFVPILALLFFFVFPWLTLYKYVAPAGPSVGISERVDMTNERMEFLSYRAAMELTVDRFVGRSTGMVLPPVFASYYPRVHEFVHGESFLQELSAFVPRVLWPNKIGLSSALNEYTVGVGMLADGTTTSAVFDCVSEYYVNFGLIGVLLLSIAHGAYEGILYGWLTTRTDRLIGSCIYATFFVINTEIFGFFYVFNWHSRQIPAWLLVFFLLSRWAAPRARRTLARQRIRR